MAAAARASLTTAAGSCLCTGRKLVRMRAGSAGVGTCSGSTGQHPGVVRGVRRVTGGADVPAEQGPIMAAFELAGRLARQAECGAPASVARQPAAAFASH